MRPFQKPLLVFSFFIFPLLVLNAQELKLKSFKHLEGNTSARINWTEDKTDVNGKKCALLILKHNFNHFIVETGKGDEGRKKKGEGETWVWLSPDEFQIVIRRQGYIPFDYNLKGKLESLETYELVVSDEFGTINVIAPNAQIWMDNKPVANDKYTFREQEGRFIIKATRDKYYPDEEFVSLHAGETVDLKFDLKPMMGTLDVVSKPTNTEGADIYIDNSMIPSKTNTKIPLIIGSYNIRIEKKGFLPYYQDINIKENQIANILANMEVDPTIQMIKHRKKKNFWLASTLVTAGVGAYSYWQADKLYSDYYSATTDAEDLHNQVETYDKIYPVAFGVAGACFIEFVVHAAKQGKAKRKLKLHPSYSKENKGLAMTYTF